MKFLNIHYELKLVYMKYNTFSEVHTCFITDRKRFLRCPFSLANAKSKEMRALENIRSQVLSHVLKPEK